MPTAHVEFFALGLLACACGTEPTTSPTPLLPDGAAGSAGVAAGGGAGSPASAAGASPHGGSAPLATGGAGATSAASGASGGAGAPNTGGAGAPTAGSSGGGAGGAAGAGGAGGAGGAAGAGGAGAVYSTDPATFGGEPRCQGLAICESFETTALGAVPAGFTLKGYGSRQVGVSAERAARGQRALKIDVAAQGAVTAWLSRTNLGTLGARHFGRAFVRIAPPAPSQFVHFDLFEGQGPFGGHTNAVRYAVTGTGAGTSTSNWSFIYNVQPSGSGAGGEFGTEGNRSAHPRVDAWMCLEWSFDATAQRATYYLDGAAIDYLRIDTERAEIPVFDSLSVGFGKYQNTDAFLVYVDEVAFHGERIGCNN